MYDAVHLFAKALHDLDTSQQIDVRPLSCEAEDTWPHGYSLINYMKIVSSLLSLEKLLYARLVKIRRQFPPFILINYISLGRWHITFIRV